jgi:hypothetical protein
MNCERYGSVETPPVEVNDNVHWIENELWAHKTTATQLGIAVRNDNMVSEWRNTSLMTPAQENTKTDSLTKVVL